MSNLRILNNSYAVLTCNCIHFISVLSSSVFNLILLFDRHLLSFSNLLISVHPNKALFLLERMKGISEWTIWDIVNNCLIEIYAFRSICVSIVSNFFIIWEAVLGGSIEIVNLINFCTNCFKFVFLNALVLPSANQKPYCQMWIFCFCVHQRFLLLTFGVNGINR